MVFRISERYRLEIHWEKAVYEQEGVAKLIGSHFTGPALKEAAAINENDFISLDFANQYMFFIPSYYIAKLSWKQVSQSSNIVHLYDAKLTNKHVNSVPKLKDDDFIVIDTKNHEDDKHNFHLTYPSYLIRFDGDLYKFGDK
jgi:hypothetical protein